MIDPKITLANYQTHSPRCGIAAATKQSFEQLLAAHLKEHQRLYRRVELDLGESKAMQQPTDVRIAYSGDGNDPHLAALHFQYGRYLRRCEDKKVYGSDVTIGGVTYKIMVAEDGKLLSKRPHQEGGGDQKHEK